MNENIYQCDLNEIKDFLFHQIAAVSSPDGMQWLKEKCTHTLSQKEFYLAFSAAPRFVGKERLRCNEVALQKTFSLRKGWNPLLYNADRAARIILLLSHVHETNATFLKTLHTLLSSADSSEQVAIYSSLALLPFPEEFVLLAAEGVRSNMRDVFDAIALENPFPADFFSENAWNQMVLKAIFINRPLFRMYDIDVRVNPSLAATLIDYVHERRAANRTITPELWRCVVPFVDEKNIADIQKLALSTDPLERKAATLVCSQSNFPEVKKILHDLCSEMAVNSLSWDSIGKEFTSLNQ
jgi:hypothetical protein